MAFHALLGHLQSVEEQHLLHTHTHTHAQEQGFFLKFQWHIYIFTCYHYFYLEFYFSNFNLTVHALLFNIINCIASIIII